MLSGTNLGPGGVMERAGPRGHGVGWGHTRRRLSLRVRTLLWCCLFVLWGSGHFAFSPFAFPGDVSPDVSHTLPMLTHGGFQLAALLRCGASHPYHQKL